jgi:energy-coupling factor transporter ATP-binding protein EcfA2
MLDKIKIENFTTFNEVEFQFGQGINVIIGDNGTGKSHLLKLAYTISTVAAQAGKASSPPSKDELQRQVATKLVSVFRPDALGRLVRARQDAVDRRGSRGRASVKLSFKGKFDAWDFSFSGRSGKEVVLESAPKVFPGAEAIFIPTKEVMSIFEGFTKLYLDREFNIDETYYDLCVALSGVPLKGPRLEQIKVLFDPIEERLGGQVVRQGDRFYLTGSQGTNEMPLVAEGVRKLSTIAHLLRNGALTQKGMVFWDEPESNLNARLIRDVAMMLMNLSAQGVQVFLATHSFFLMKEIDMLKRQDARFAKVPTRYMTLGYDEQDQPVFEQGDTLKDVSRIVALDQELAQYDRELSGGGI